MATHAHAHDPRTHAEHPAGPSLRMNGQRRGWTTGQLAELLGAELIGPADLRIERLDAIDHADASSVTFVRDAKRVPQWDHSRAAAAIVTRGVEIRAGEGRALLIVDDADRATIAVLETLTPPTHAPRTGVHPSAVIDPSARIDATAAVGPGVTIGPRTTVGARTVLHAGVTLGADVRIGEDCELRAGVVVEDRCALGSRVRLHANAVIGADGFGYRPSADGRSLVKIPHAGNVEIGDDVEVGANTAIDRGKFGPTVVGAGAKIDNLVQIGHGVQIGRVCLLAGQVGIGGSSVVGDGVMMGGQAGIADNLKVGPGAKLAAKTGVLSDLPAGEAVFGTPALPVRMALRAHAILRQMASGRGRSRGEPRRDAGASS